MTQQSAIYGSGIDWDALASDNKGFTLYQVLAASGANYSTFQLLNPSGSGVVIYIDSWQGSLNGTHGNSIQFNFRRYDSTLISDSGVWRSNSPSRAVGKGHGYYYNHPTYLGTPTLTTLRFEQGSYNVAHFRVPIPLTPGQGLLMGSSGPNMGIQGSWYGHEVVI